MDTDMPDAAATAAPQGGDGNRPVNTGEQAVVIPSIAITKDQEETVIILTDERGSLEAKHGSALRTSVHANPTRWFQAIVSTSQREAELLEKAKATKRSYDDAIIQLNRLTVKNDDLDVTCDEHATKLSSKKRELEIALADVARLRKQRDDFRAKVSAAEEEVKMLKEASKKASEQSFADNRHLQPEYLDFMSDEDRLTPDMPLRPKPRGRSRSPGLRAPVMRQRSRTRSSQSLNVRTYVHNYPDAPKFSGTDKEDNYLQWKMQVQSKWNMTGDAYESTWARINYLRDRCKGAAFQLICDRADPYGKNPYTSVDQVWADLDKYFKPENEEMTARNKVAEASFAMQPGEDINDFVLRFTETIRPLDYSDAGKAHLFYTNLVRALRLKLSDGHDLPPFVDLLIRAKNLFTQLEGVYGKGKVGITETQRPKKGEDEKPKGNRQAQGSGGSTTPNLRIPHRPTALFGALKDQNRCIRCGEVGHEHTEKEKCPLFGKAAKTNAEMTVIVASTDEVKPSGN
ncbi:hypothetical protein EJ06DRAFT_560219 [Trichodelitschia bisporula]|uniref:Retrotransposon gag domain-containing protein n=1 Tax=Trichodelitschia bisporula TaxID=703511 RepID=A0A6G1HJ91_9PEZI|nr:hypothetical protein EJ06DRAFT_560219 [Trichodelitschia bisporula]